MTTPLLGYTDDPRPHTVYLHIDATGAVLYVGCTVNLETRTRQHEAKSAWFPQVVEVREVGTWPRFIALGVEKGLIAQYDAPGNYVGTRAWRLDLADRQSAPDGPRPHSRAAARPLATARESVRASRAEYEAYAAGNSMAMTYLSWARNTVADPLSMTVGSARRQGRKAS